MPTLKNDVTKNNLLEDTQNIVLFKHVVLKKFGVGALDFCFMFGSHFALAQHKGVYVGIC